MPRVESIIARVSSLRDGSIDASLAAALPTADAQAQGLLVQQLLRRNHAVGKKSLVEHYHLLPLPWQQELQSRIGSLVIQVALVLRTEENPTAAASALLLLRQAGDPHLAYLLPLGLRSPFPEVQQQAAHTLWTLTQNWVQQQLAASSSPSPADDSLGQTRALAIMNAIAEAVAIFGGHRQNYVLLALLHAGPMMLDRVHEILDDPRHDAVAALRTLLAAGSDPNLRQALPGLMLQPTLAQAALAGFRQSRSRSHEVDIFTDPHLLLLPRMRAAVRSMTPSLELAPAADEIAKMSPAQWRALPAWLMHLPLEPHDRLARLGLLTTADDDLARLIALRALMEIHQPALIEEARSLIARFTFDPRESTAILALRHLLRCHWLDLPKLLPKLVNSTHPRLRALATAALAPIAFESLWKAWPRLSAPQRLSAGQAQIKLDPLFPRRVSERLNAKSRSGRVRALSLISTLGQGPLFEKAILYLVDSSDPRIAATAVRALGTVPTPLAIAMLEKCLHHADTRLRANAVEALDHLGHTTHRQVLVHMIRDEESRPRIAAVRSLLRLGDPRAPGALADMLADRRPPHRIAALWLIETAQLADMTRHVAELALADPDPAVRLRAQRTTERLLQTMRDETPPNLNASTSAAAG